MKLHTALRILLTSGISTISESCAAGCIPHLQKKQTQRHHRQQLTAAQPLRHPEKEKNGRNYGRLD